MAEWYEEGPEFADDVPAGAGIRPKLFLGVAAGLEVFAVALMIVSDRVRVLLAAYLVGSLAPLMLVAFSRRIGDHLSAERGVSQSPAVRTSSVLLTLLALVIAAAGSFMIAKEL